MSFFEGNTVRLLADIPDKQLHKNQQAEVIEVNEDANVTKIEIYNEWTYQWIEVEVPTAILELIEDD